MNSKTSNNEVTPQYGPFSPGRAALYRPPAILGPFKRLMVGGRKAKPLAEAIWRILLTSILVIMLASCNSLGKPKIPPAAPPASCEERAPAISPSDPPNSRDYRDWSAAWIQAVYAWMDVTMKRMFTADCVDENRKIKP